MRESAPTVGSLFAGIGGCDLGFERSGWTTVWQVEIDEWCRKVLAKHFPDAERFADVRECGSHNLSPVDCIVGGFPCQDMSVAGKRAGLAGERSGLFWEFVRITSELRPAFVVLENVPGLLSSNGGRDMGSVIGGLEDAGYSCAWRVLDSQWFGVAQRRRRVFIVGHSDAGRAGEVLFEPESGDGHPAAMRKAATDIAHCLDGRTGGVSGKENQETMLAYTIRENNRSTSQGPTNLVAHTLLGVHRGIGNAWNTNYVSHTLNAKGGSGRLTGESETFVVNARQDPIHGHVCLDGDGHSHAVAVAENQRGELRESSISPALSAGGGKPGSGYSAVAVAEKRENEPLTLEGVRRILQCYADATKANANTILQIVRSQAGAQTAAQRLARIVVAFWEAEVLQPEVHGKRFSGSLPSCRANQAGPLSGEDDCDSNEVQGLRCDQEPRCPPPRQESIEQQPSELGRAVPVVSQSDSQPEKTVRDLWETPEGKGLLQQTLDSIQAARRPVAGESEPVSRPLLVRRLVPTECERLQGFPDGWTIPNSSKDPLPKGIDGRRYKALGNAVTVQVAEWIGRRMKDKGR